MGWLRLMGSKTYGTRKKRQATRRPHLEALEDRQLLATCHVVRLGDFGAGADLGGGQSRGDLRYCINKANDEPGPDTILLQVSGTIDLNGSLPVASDMTIQGPGSDVLTIRRHTGGNYRVFTVTGDTVAISGMTISEGVADAGGGIYNQGALALDDVVIKSNTSTGGHGGGIFNVGNLSIANSTIRANVATSVNFGHGGGIYSQGAGFVTISSSVITGNQALSTGGNQEVAGGGIYLGYGAHLTLNQSTISFNAARTSKGIQNNSALGGGLFSLGTASIQSSAVYENIAATDGKFSTSYGGGIFTAGPELVVANTTIARNVAEARSYGGVIGNGHTSRAYGGGIYQYDLVMRISHSTIVGNRCNNPPELPPMGSKEAGGGIYSRGISLLGMHHTVVAKNSTQSNQCPDLSADLAGSYRNVISKPACTSGLGASDIVNLDPLLGPLQDNGGLTLTIALLPGSPAIDSGDPNPVDPPQWDQRGPGFPRIVNGVIDRGAFEVQATGAPARPNLAVLITANLNTDDGITD